MNDQTKKMIDKAIAKADQAAKGWLEDREKDIAETVRRMLDARLKEIVAQLLGFYANFKVDHCNGRHGESAAGDWFREKAGDAVREWLTEQAGKLPKLSAKSISNLRRHYLDRVEDELMDAVRDKAIDDARSAIEEGIKSIIGGEGTE